MSPDERARYIRAFGRGIRDRAELFGEIWPRESGVLRRTARAWFDFVLAIYDRYADLAETFAFDEPPRSPRARGATPSWSGSRSARRAPSYRGTPRHPPAAIKLGPAFAAGCTVVVKGSPEAPGDVDLMAEVAHSIGLPPGVLSFATADREVSDLLVRDPRVDKIAFIGSTATGRRIASLCGERTGRYTLELGGTAALVLDDFDLGEAARPSAGRSVSCPGRSAPR